MADPDSNIIKEDIEKPEVTALVIELVLFFFVLVMAFVAGEA